MATTKRPSHSSTSSAPTHEAILEAAIRVFLAHGYDKVSMDLLAEASGVARRTLYNQFPNGKETIFRASVEHFWSGFPQLSWSPESETDPRAGLLQVAETVADFWKDEEVIAFLRLAIAEVNGFPDLMKTLGKNGRLVLMSELVTYLEQQVKAKTLNIPDYELAMRQFFGLICEPLLWVRVVGLTKGATSRYRQTVVESAVDMFLSFYRRTS